MIKEKKQVVGGNFMVSSDLEIISELDKTEKRIKGGKVKFSSVEQSYKKNMDFIDNFKL